MFVVVLLSGGLGARDGGQHRDGLSINHGAQLRRSSPAVISAGKVRSRQLLTAAGPNTVHVNTSILRASSPTSGRLHTHCNRTRTTLVDTARNVVEVGLRLVEVNPDQSWPKGVQVWPRRTTTWQQGIGRRREKLGRAHTTLVETSPTLGERGADMVEPAQISPEQVRRRGVEHCHIWGRGRTNLALCRFIAEAGRRTWPPGWNERWPPDMAAG